MKIAISSVGNNSEALVDLRFGRCSYFQIYDLESGEVKYIENQGSTTGGGAGIAAAQQVLDEEVDVVVTGNVGPNAYNIFDKSEIKLYKTSVVSVKESLDKYKQGELEEITESGRAHQGMGNGNGFKGGR